LTKTPKLPPGDRAVGFIESLSHTKGIYAGQQFLLEDWQEEMIREIFGKVNSAGHRIIRTAYVEIPRKNGKSEIGAAIALKLLFADDEIGAEIYSCAGDRQQANQVFNVAAMMVRQHPQLRKLCKIIDSQKRIIIPDRGSFYCSISAESKTKHGFNASGIIFDELHVQPNRDLWDVMETSKGSEARKQPLTFAITTAGFDKHSICYEQHEYGERVNAGIIDDPTFYSKIFAAPPEADWTDEEVWRACNPALGSFRSLEEMRSFSKKAQAIPALENTFRRLYLNQWTAQETRWLSMPVWDASEGDPVDPDALLGRSCYAGLDLASTTDIAALVLVFPPEEKDGEFVVLPFFWIPEEAMQERSRRDRVPYDVWTRSGLIQATPGNVIDYKFILHTINQIALKYDLQEIAFDRWGASKIIQEIEEDGGTAVAFGQGFASMSPPTKELLTLTLQKRIRHGGNPVLRWMADNLVVKEDPAGNVKPDKSKSTEKIDGMVALIMGLDRAIKRASFVSVYESRGVFTA